MPAEILTLPSAAKVEGSVPDLMRSRYPRFAEFPDEILDGLACLFEEQSDVPHGPAEIVAFPIRRKKATRGEPRS